MKLRDHNPNQDRAELEQFVAFAVENRVRSYLEIGSRFGDSFFAVMANLPRRSLGVTIDIPCCGELLATHGELSVMGKRTYPMRLSSHEPEALRMARMFTPQWDLILIDGDHTYEGVAQDWRTFAPLGRFIALHDIAAPPDWDSDGKPNNVQRFWNELKASGGERVVAEFVTEGSNMGYGLVRGEA